MLLGYWRFIPQQDLEVAGNRAVQAQLPHLAVVPGARRVVSRFPAPCHQSPCTEAALTMRAPLALCREPGAFSGGKAARAGSLSRSGCGAGTRVAGSASPGSFGTAFRRGFPGTASTAGLAARAGGKPGPGAGSGNNPGPAGEGGAKGPPAAALSTSSRRGSSRRGARAAAPPRSSGRRELGCGSARGLLSQWTPRRCLRGRRRVFPRPAGTPGARPGRGAGGARRCRRQVPCAGSVRSASSGTWPGHTQLPEPSRVRSP